MADPYDAKAIMNEPTATPDANIFIRPCHKSLKSYESCATSIMMIAFILIQSNGAICSVK